MSEQNSLGPQGESLDELIKVFGQGSLGVTYRQGLIRDLERQVDTTVVLYMANIRHPAAAMNLQDAVLLENTLRQAEPVKNLDLIVNSPGGSAEAADKILHVCRQFCPKGCLRLIVPYFAKSAATMLAFGADEVVMGPYSELGPIDAQVKIVEGGVENYISAQTYVDVLEDLQHRIREEEKSGAVSQSLLVQLASLNLPFVEHCQRLQMYATDFSVRWMCRYTLHDEHEAGPEGAKEKALKTANALLKRGFFSHTQMLTARDLKGEPGIHLKITELNNDDPAWRLIWQLHCACEVVFITQGSNLSKLFESSKTTFPVY